MIVRVLARSSRADLEVAILENDILPTSTPDELAAVGAMSEAELRSAVQAWIEASDECAAC